MLEHLRAESNDEAEIARRHELRVVEAPLR